MLNTFINVLDNTPSHISGKVETRHTIQKAKTILIKQGQSNINRAAHPWHLHTL